ncbi:MAG: twin-arginine translocase subunit TatC, partial [Elusimicrobiota bacterium]
MTDEPVPLLDHLQELSSRLWTCLICCLAFALLGYMLVDHIIGALAKSAGGFVFTHPTEAFFARVKIAMMT